MLADRRRALQILNNLVSNAIKFTPEGGRVTLSASLGGPERDGAVVIKVHDTGCGIPPDEQKRIFQRFSQGRTERREGVGLGLAIARELVQQHRGELWVDSEPGRGATFSFTLPLAPDPSEKEELNPPPPVPGAGARDGASPGAAAPHPHIFY